MLVRAKRAGWDRKDGYASDVDDYDPPAWVDAGLDEWVEGELEVTELPADGMYKARKVYRVDGESVDPETVEELKVQKSSPDRVLEAMDQIGHGREKFTSLADLGRRLGGSPQALHQAVMQLWRSGKLTVSAAEGRSGSTEAERRWWMEAQGETLGYVSLRR